LEIAKSRFSPPFLSKQNVKPHMNMKLKFKFPLVICTVLAATVGCKPSDQSQNQGSSGTSAVTREVKEAYKDLTEATKEAATTTKNYVVEGKDEFVATADKKLKELDAKINELSDKSASYKDDAKAQADQALTALREQRAAVSVKFEAVKQASAETWKDVKTGFDTAISELEKAYENVKTKLSQPNPGQ
jgi:CHASE3 domain sensor protein